MLPWVLKMARTCTSNLNLHLARSLSCQGGGGGGGSHAACLSLTCGEIEFMDKAYENLTPKDEKNLERIERAFYSPTTSDDPMIRQLITENAGNVFGTDAIFALLMVCIKSLMALVLIARNAHQCHAHLHRRASARSTRGISWCSASAAD